MTKRPFLPLFSCLLLCLFLFQNCQESAPKLTERDRFVQDLLKTMSLTDKVGEMTQVAIDLLSDGEAYDLNEPHQLVEEKLRKVLVEHRVGSILNVGGHAYTQDHWHDIMTKIQKIATEEKPSKIPVLYGIDAIHGVNFTKGATLFPQQLGLACTWNTNLATQMGTVSSYETRASAIPWNFSPVCDLGRDPRWSRLWETFGEDVHLASQMARATVAGYEGGDVANKNRVASCLKHFMGYSMPLSGKDRTPAWIPERHLREYIMPPFQAAMDAGAQTVMICSGELNGEPVHASKWLLTDILRGEMGFEGLAVSDWEDIHFLYDRHRVATDYKDAIRIAINAGIDMSMVPVDVEFAVLLKALVEEGKVPMSRIDEAVTRILRLKYDLGLFTNPFYPKADYPAFASEDHRKIAYQAASESIVLLKNEKDLLPLDPQQNILVTGPTANQLRSLNGGWTGTWQGDNPQYDTEGKATILQAIQNKIGAAQVSYVEGASFDQSKNISQAVAAAKRASVVVACLGELSYTEKPGDIDDLYLPTAQVKLLEALATTGKPIVVILAEGRPRCIPSIEAKSDAILAAFYPGNEGGIALADILFGTINPSGKLAITYPRYPNSLERYDHKGTDMINRDFSHNGFNPQFEFGHGLSYTSFAYSDLQLDTLWSGEQALTIKVTVKNTGSRAGKEVVQLFVTDKVASITPAVKRLRAFKKISLAPAESQTLSFELSKKDLAFVGKDNTWITEAGVFEVAIGRTKQSFTLQ